MTLVIEHADMANGHVSVLCVGNYGHFDLLEQGSVRNSKFYMYGSRFKI